MSSLSEKTTPSLKRKREGSLAKSQPDPFGDLELPRLPSLEDDANDSKDVAHLKRVLNKEFGPTNAWHRLTHVPYVDRNTHVVAVAGTLPGTSSPDHQGWHLTELLFWYHLYEKANLGSEAFLTCVNLEEVVQQYKQLLWYKHEIDFRKVVLDAAIYNDQFADIGKGQLTIRDGTTIDKAYLIGEFLDQVQIACRRADESGQEGHVLVFIFSGGNSAGELRIGSHFITAEHIRQRVEATGTKSRVTIITSAFLSAGLTYLNLDDSQKPLDVSMVADEKVLWPAYACGQTPTSSPPIRHAPLAPYEVVNYLLEPDFGREITREEQRYLWRKCRSFRKLAEYLSDNYFLQPLNCRIPVVDRRDLLHFEEQDQLRGLNCSPKIKSKHFDYVEAFEAIPQIVPHVVQAKHTSACGLFEIEVPARLVAPHVSSQASALLDSESKDKTPTQYSNVSMAMSGLDRFVVRCQDLASPGEFKLLLSYQVVSEGLDQWMMRVKSAEFFLRLLNLKSRFKLNDMQEGYGGFAARTMDESDVLRTDLNGYNYWRISTYLGFVMLADERFYFQGDIRTAVRRLKHVSWYITGTLHAILRDAFSNKDSPAMKLLAKLRKERRQRPFESASEAERQRASVPILIPTGTGGYNKM